MPSFYQSPELESLQSTPAVRAFLDDCKNDGIYRLQCRLPRYWLADNSSDEFGLIVQRQQGIWQQALFIDQSAQWQQCCGKSLPPLATIANWPGVGVLDLQQPLPLHSVAIPKPWGQEIWYTGVEQRGVCQIGQHYPVLLPRALQCLGAVLGLPEAANELVLLKILDPLPEPVYGDLYFELHEQKQEVYVVTHVDATAWPEGQGAIRFGFSPAKRQQFADEHAFKTAYLAAVAAYEQVRRSIDQELDQYRQQAGIELTAPVGAQQLQTWAKALPEQLRTQEQQLRANMDAFTRLLPLQVGDVVKVPCFTPHALQHGVRTVEFQTPVYERKILSFAQKVLTQNHWDTAAAADIMTIACEQPEPPRALPAPPGCQLEHIVDFSDFDAWRLQLAPGACYRLPQASCYRLLLALGQGVMVAGTRCPPEQAFLLPRALAAGEIANRGPVPVVVLLARPKLAAGVG